MTVKITHFIAVVLSLLGSSANIGAWTFTPSPICTVEHQTELIELELTYNHASGVYALKLTKPELTWDASRKFSMRFEGSKPIFISTTNHEFSSDMKSLIASDSGFGNVIDGLQFNTLAAAITDNERIFIPLTGAEPKIDAFRNCAEAQRI